MISRLMREELQWLLSGADGAFSTEPLRGAAILSGAFNPLHAGHVELAAAAGRRLGRPVVFELPLLNADKPTLDASELERRLAQFRGRHAVLLTRSPLFLQKAALFPGSTFVVGYDTAERLLDPKYYGGDGPRDRAMGELAGYGCQFLVAARVQAGQLRTLDDVRVGPLHQSLFLELPASEFRMDLSSTQLRRGGA